MPVSAARTCEDATSAATQAVIAAGKWAAARGWLPATSGNLSVRIDARQIAITRSGPDKGNLVADDILVVDLDHPPAAASAEAPLHYALYADHPQIAAIVHVHSPAATVLSRLRERDGAVSFSGWELQKALAGVRSHEETVRLPIVANDQDTDRLAETVRAELSRTDGAFPAPGYLIAGHGLYAWGPSPADALRHLEALETLCSYQLTFERSAP